MIEKNHGRLDGFRLPDRFHAVCGRENIVSLRFEIPTQKTYDMTFVVDDEYFYHNPSITSFYYYLFFIPVSIKNIIPKSAICSACSWYRQFSTPLIRHGMCRPGAHSDRTTGVPVMKDQAESPMNRSTAKEELLLSVPACPVYPSTGALLSSVEGLRMTGLNQSLRMTGLNRDSA
jgi:hypothetical protein